MTKSMNFDVYEPLLDIVQKHAEWFGVKDDSAMSVMLYIADAVITATKSEPAKFISVDYFTIERAFADIRKNPKKDFEGGSSE